MTPWINIELQLRSLFPWRRIIRFWIFPSLSRSCFLASYWQRYVLGIFFSNSFHWGPCLGWLFRLFTPNRPIDFDWCSWVAIFIQSSLQGSWYALHATPFQHLILWRVSHKLWPCDLMIQRFRCLLFWRCSAVFWDRRVPSQNQISADHSRPYRLYVGFKDSVKLFSPWLFLRVIFSFARDYRWARWLSPLHLQFFLNTRIWRCWVCLFLPTWADYYLLALDPILEFNSIFLHFIVFLPNVSEVVVCGLVLSISGFEWLNAQFVEIIACEEGEVGMSEFRHQYLTPRLTELRAASLKDSSGS